MCDMAGPLLSSYVDGQMDGNGRRRVEEHVAGCAVCRRRLERLGAVRDWVRASAPAAEAVDLLPLVLAAAASVDARRERARLRVRHAAGAIVLAAAVAVLAILAGRSAPMLVGSDVMRASGRMLRVWFGADGLPARVRLALLLLLLLAAWGATRRLRRALHSLQPHP